MIRRRLARFGRSLFAVAAAASLLVCVGTIYVWARAAPGERLITFNARGGRYWVEAGWVGLTMFGPPVGAIRWRRRSRRG